MASEIEVLSGSDILGCTDDIACNYDSEATLNDGSCEYALENFDCDGIMLRLTVGECGGDAVVDECGECGEMGLVQYTLNHRFLPQLMKLILKI